MAHKKISINRDYIYQNIGKEVVMFSSEKSELFTLNETASFMFKKLLKGQSVDAIVEAMTKKFDTKKDVVTKDLYGLISTLKKDKVIEQR